MPGSDTVKFLTLEEVLEIHSALIERFGGRPGARDLGLLESALFRPQTGYYDNLLSMSAALFESLIMNHPFVDGNKRVGFFSTDIFLRLNGYRIKVDGKEGHRFLVGLLESNRCTLENLLPWIETTVIDLDKRYD